MALPDNQWPSSALAVGIMPLAIDIQCFAKAEQADTGSTYLMGYRRRAKARQGRRARPTIFANVPALADHTDGRHHAFKAQTE